MWYDSCLYDFEYIKIDCCRVRWPSCWI